LGRGKLEIRLSELLRSNDPVLLSFAQSLLAGAGIGYFLADGHMSVLDGSVGAVPRRLLVAAEDLAPARTLLHGAGLGRELSTEMPVYG
jgi:hypothetical protein